MNPCHHPVAYQNQLETEHFFLIIVRCQVCDGFISCKSHKKADGNPKVADDFVVENIDEVQDLIKQKLDDQRGH